MQDQIDAVGHRDGATKTPCKRMSWFPEIHLFRASGSPVRGEARLWSSPPSCLPETLLLLCVCWLVVLVVVKYISKSNAILTHFKVPESCLPEQNNLRERISSRRAMDRGRASQPVSLMLEAVEGIEMSQVQQKT